MHPELEEDEEEELDVEEGGEVHQTSKELQVPPVGESQHSGGEVSEMHIGNGRAGFTQEGTVFAIGQII